MRRRPSYPNSSRPRSTRCAAAAGLRSSIRRRVSLPSTMNNPSATRRGHAITPAQPKDVPAIFNLAPQVFRVHKAADLEQHLFQNAYFPPESVFVARARDDPTILAAGVLISAPDYADPKQVDAA